jgi:hypothetical protein
MIYKKPSGTYYSIRIQVNSRMHLILLRESKLQGIKISKILRKIALELINSEL